MVKKRKDEERRKKGEENVDIFCKKDLLSKDGVHFRTACNRRPTRCMVITDDNSKENNLKNKRKQNETNETESKQPSRLELLLSIVSCFLCNFHFLE